VSTTDLLSFLLWDVEGNPKACEFVPRGRLTWEQTSGGRSSENRTTSSPRGGLRMKERKLTIFSFNGNEGTTFPELGQKRINSKR